MCWSIILMLSKLTDIVEITPRNWIMPNCHFCLFVSKRDLGVVVREQNLKTASRQYFGIADLVTTREHQSWVFRCAKFRWTRFASFITVNTMVSLNSGWTGAGLTTVSCPSPCFFSEPNNRNVYVCTVSAFPPRFYDTVLHCLLFLFYLLSLGFVL